MPSRNLAYLRRLGAAYGHWPIQDLFAEHAQRPAHAATSRSFKGRQAVGANIRDVVEHTAVARQPGHNWMVRGKLLADAFVELRLVAPDEPLSNVVGRLRVGIALRVLARLLLWDHSNSFKSFHGLPLHLKHGILVVRLQDYFSMSAKLNIACQPFRSIWGAPSIC